MALNLLYFGDLDFELEGPDDDLCYVSRTPCDDVCLESFEDFLTSLFN